jgi:predicted DCC family thiol-disulfide oxidoreductase YuxK
MSHPVLLYDGVCGLCNRFVRFILRRDPDGVFGFAALQSPVASRILGRHGKDPQDFDTVYIVVDSELAGERIFARSDAVIFALKQLAEAAELHSSEERLDGQRAAMPTQTRPRPKLWRLAARFLELIPRPVRDWGYRIVARHRYRLFGRYDACPVPEAETKSRFLDG